MTAMDYVGLVIVVAIWAGIVAMACHVLSFNHLDDDPDERDPYN